MENWADTLIIQYEEGRKELHRMKEALGDSDLDKLDRSQINSMISSMSYSIDWMKLGRRPGNMRGIDKRNAYQRRALVDIETLPSLEIEPEERILTEEEKKTLFDMLIDLSHRERQCYLLHFAQGMSMQEVANELGITKSSVQKFINRAKSKIERKKSLSYECHTKKSS